MGEMKGKGNSSRYRIHRDGEREGEKEDNLLYFSPSSAPSFAFGQVMQITLLNKKSKHAGPPSTPTSTSSSSSISRYIFPLLLLSSSLLPLCRWRLSISRQDCICRLVASPPSLHSMHKAAGKAPGRQRGSVGGGGLQTRFHESRQPGFYRLAAPVVRINGSVNWKTLVIVSIIQYFADVNVQFPPFADQLHCI